MARKTKGASEDPGENWEDGQEDGPIADPSAERKRVPLGVQVFSQLDILLASCFGRGRRQAAGTVVGP